MRKLGAIALGEIIVDIVVHLPRLPSEKDTWHESVRATDVAVCPGGAGSYFAQVLARLGVSCGMMGKVGDDFLGHFLTDSLKREGVDVGSVKTWKKGTPRTVILTLDNGKKVSLGGGKGGVWPDLTLRDIDLSYLDQAKLFHFGGYYFYRKMWGRPTVKLMRYAREKGLTTMLDTQMDRSGRYAGDLNKVLTYVDILLLDEFEATSISKCASVEKAADKLLSYGPTTVGIKLGGRGCFVASEEESLSVPGFRTRVVDTIGAGDAWNAGFGLGELYGWNLKKKAEFANAVGAFSVSGPGGIAGVPTRKGVDLFLKRQRRTSSQSAGC